MQRVLQLYGLSEGSYAINPIGNGLINDTFKVESNGATYIAQRVNHNVFKDPYGIDANINHIAEYFAENHPNYMFTVPVPALGGRTVVHIPEYGYCRMFKFVPDSRTHDVAYSPIIAYEAAKQFGMFTSFLDQFPAERLTDTIPDFHNLKLRHDQFITALESCRNSERLDHADVAIQALKRHHHISLIYEDIISGRLDVRRRVCHHDTKISNVLFGSSDNGICVIDLDTVMAGYFISDLGDMFRTYLCADSEETVLEPRIEDGTIAAPQPGRIRLDYFRAVVNGYLGEMRPHLTEDEKGLVLYAGKFMIYMQAMRFLTDYLNGDVYYKVAHDRHNLERAVNQLVLLAEFTASEPVLTEIVHEALQTV